MNTIKYLRSHSLDELEQSVQQMLNGGWHLYGPLVAYSTEITGIWYIQTVTSTPQN